MKKKVLKLRKSFKIEKQKVFVNNFDKIKK
jgi:hypothetical protein